MALKDIQLCHMDPVDRAQDKFTVTVHSEGGSLYAMFDCSSKHDARELRNAIRDHATRLKRVADYNR